MEEVRKVFMMDFENGAGMLQMEILEGNPFLRWRAISEWDLRNTRLPDWKEDVNELLELPIPLKERMDVLDAMLDAMLSAMEKM